MTVALAGAPVELDPRDPLVRLAQLFDDATTRCLHEPDGSGVLAARGRIAGRPVVAYCTDAVVMGGAMGSLGCQHIVDAITTAAAEGVPVVGIWHSGGARLAEGVHALESVGCVFAAMVAVSGRIPQISVVVGPAAGGAAYGPALTDVVVMSEAGRVFVTGPDVVRTVTGEDVSMAELGGPVAHGRRSGVVHVVTATEAEAYARAREITALLAEDRSRPVGAPAALSSAADVRPGLDVALPERRRRAYDVRPVVLDVLDDRHLEELQAGYARNIVVGLGRLGGRPVGVIANNPLHKAGCLDSTSAEKAARFVRMCDAFGVPLAVFVDVPGYLPGVGEEWGGVVRRGAKLLHAFASARVPRCTVVLRKSFGGAYIAMNGRCLGATRTFAWPDAEIAVMGASAAVGILHKRRLAATPEHERPQLLAELVAEQERATAAMRLDVVDEVIDPRQTRRRLIDAFAQTAGSRGQHCNIPL